MKKQLILAAAALALAACSNDENLNPNDGPVEIRLSSGIEVQTRAYTPTQGTQIANGETVYVWGDDVDGTDATEYISAWTLTANGSGGFTGISQYFPQTGHNINLYAIHGNFTGTTFTEGATEFPSSVLTHTVESNQSIEANYCKSDLLYAVNQGVSRNGHPTTTVPMTFYHMLSKVEVALKAGSGLTDTELQSAEVTLEGTKRTVTFTPTKTGDLTADATRSDMVSVVTEGSAGSITIPTVTIGSATDFTNANYGEAVIVPQTLTVNTQFIKVHLEQGGELYYSLPAAVTFESGKKYTYNITVNLTGLTVTSEITDWDTEEGGYTGDNDGSATMQ